MSVTSSVESAQESLLAWFREDKSHTLDSPEYEQVAAKVKQLVEEQSLLKQDLTLHHQHFNWGFDFFYGELGGEKLIPISWSDGIMLKWQAKHGGCWWAIKNPSDQYFVPNVTLNEMKPPSGSMPTHQYLNDLIKWAEFKGDCRERRILQALKPYSEQIQSACHPATFAKIVRLFPSH